MGIPDYESAAYKLDPENKWVGSQSSMNKDYDAELYEFRKDNAEVIEDIRQSYDYLEKASDKQIGGNHYKKFMIQPAEFCYYNNIPYLEATAIKYLCRWKDKGGIQDLEKAKHFIDLLIEFQNGK